MATGFPVKANYAAGDVLTAANMDDLAGTLNYLNGVPYSKNAVYNSAADIWQRGTTFTNTVGYTADRWYQAASNVTTTQETSAVPTGFASAIKGTATASTQPYWLQALETKDAIRFAGQTVALSAYAATSDSSNFLLRIDYSTSVDNSALGTWTTIASTSVAATSTIARTSAATFAIPSTAKSLRIVVGAAGSIASTASVTFTGIQMELGTVSTPFYRQTGSIQGELAACQRYYYRVFPNASASILCPSLYCSSSTLAYGTLQFPTQMRIMPTALEQTGTASDYVVYASIGGTTCSAVPTFYDANYNSAVVKFTVASGLNTGYSGYARTGSTAGYLGWSAEL